MNMKKMRQNNFKMNRKKKQARDHDKVLKLKSMNEGNWKKQIWRLNSILKHTELGFMNTKTLTTA